MYSYEKTGIESWLRNRVFFVLWDSRRGERGSTADAQSLWQGHAVGKRVSRNLDLSLYTIEIEIPEFSRLIRNSNSKGHHEGTQVKDEIDERVER